MASRDPEDIRCFIEYLTEELDHARQVLAEVEGGGAGAAEPAGAIEAAVVDVPTIDPPEVDYDGYAIIYRGERCSLGDGPLFRLAAVLVDRAGAFIADEALADQVGGQDSAVADSTIRSWVCRLKDTLMQGNRVTPPQYLPSLADAIERLPGSYGMRPVWKSDGCNNRATAGDGDDVIMPSMETVEVTHDDDE